MKILVTDTIADSGIAILRDASDMEVDYRPGLKGDELHLYQFIPNYTMLYRHVVIKGYKGL